MPEPRNGEREERLRSLLGAALALPSAERSRFLCGLSGADAELRSELELLLGTTMAGQRSAWSSIEADARATISLGDCVGGYRLVRELPADSRGRSFVAEPADGSGGPRALVRLLRSTPCPPDAAQAVSRLGKRLAALKHPALADFLGSGLASGVPYVVREHIVGASLPQFAAARKLGLAERLALFLQACDVVELAHQHLFEVWRDEPTPLLVDEAGRVRLVELGGAQLLEAAGAFRWNERAASSEPSSTEGDVRALGAVLYELLAGAPPGAARSTAPASTSAPGTTTGSTLPAVSSGPRTSTGSSLPAATGVASLGGLPSSSPIVDHAESTLPPSAAAASSGRGEVARRARALRGELDAITLRALETAGGARYHSAASLSCDVRCYLDRRPVQAMVDHPGYQARVFLRRHALALAVVAVTLGGATVGGIAAVQGYRKEAALARSAEQAARRADRVNRFFYSLLRSNGPLAPGDRAASDPSFLETALELAPHELSSEPEALDAVWTQLVFALRQRHELGRAEALARRVLAHRTQTYGEVDARVAAAHSLLGTLLSEQGRPAEAQQELQQALQLARKTVGEDSVVGADAFSGLGATQAALGHFASAEAYRRRALILAEKLFGRDSEPHARAQGLLAAQLVEMRRFDDAEPFLRAASAWSRSHLGADHPETLVRQYELAVVQAERAHWTEAEELLMEVLPRQEHQLGAAHPDTLLSLRLLARLRALAGQYDEAEQLLGSTLRRQQETLGADSPPVAFTLLQWAEKWLEQGEPARSEELARRAAEVLAARLGPRHPDTAWARYELGKALLEQGRAEQADIELAFAEQVLRESGGERDPSYAATLDRRGLAAAERGQRAEARAFYTRALQVLESAGRGASPQAATALWHLASASSGELPPAEREKMHQRAVARLRAALPTGHPDTVDAVQSLAAFYLRTGNPRVAEPLLVEALAARRERHGAAHPLARQTEEMLAVCRKALASP